MGKYAAVALGAAGIGGLAVVLKTGIAEFAEASKVAAQTGAVIKSTGSAANVTAKDVATLSEALMRKSGVDDETIASGQNMLLTFKSIRNETGKGNDVFNQATKATLDLSVAMGTDMSKSAIMVGKALNDPIRGLGAMRRVGIQFTAAQETMIKGMVKSGDVMGAQKVILGELNSQFGGSAEAIGKTLPGQINVLKESFSNLSGQIVTALVPAFTSVVTWLAEMLPKAQAFVAAFKDQVGPAFDSLKTAIRGAVDVGLSLSEWIRDNQTLVMTLGGALAGLVVGIKAYRVAVAAAAIVQAAFNAVVMANPYVIAAVAIAALAGALVVLYTRSETVRNVVNRAFAEIKSVVLPIVAAVQAAWARFGDDLIKVATTAFNTVRQVVTGGINAVKNVIQAVMAAIRGDWSQAWNHLKTAASSALSAMTAVVRNFGPLLLTAGTALGKAVLNGLKQGLEGIANWVRERLTAVRQAVADAATAIYGNALAIGKAIGQGILDGIASLKDAVVEKAKEIAMAPVNAAKGVLGIDSPSKVFIGIGEDTIRGFILGITTQQPALEGKMAEATQKALDKARSTVERFQTAFGDAFGKLGDFAKRAFDQKTQNLLDNVSRKFDAQIAKWQRYASAMTPAEKALADMDAAEQKRSRDSALAAAQEQMAKAEALTDEVERAAAITAAQEALRVAQLSITRAGLEERAAAERAARETEAAEHIAKLEETKARELQNLEERRRQLGEKLDEQLTTLQERLSKHPEEYDKIQGKIQKLLKSYDIPMQKSGELLGKAFARGLDNAADEVRKSAKKLAEIVAKYLKLNSPAKAGPLSSLNTWFKPLGPMLAKQMDGRAMAAAAGRMAGAATVGARPMAMAGAGGRGGNTYVTVNMPNYLGNVRDAAREIRAELNRTAARNG